LAKRLKKDLKGQKVPKVLNNVDNFVDNFDIILENLKV
jgi:hypothetical protein